jgi:peroxiredoxin
MNPPGQTPRRKNNMKFSLKYMTGILVALMLCPILLKPKTIQESKFPHRVNLLSLENKTINSETFTNNGKPVIILYWLTTCSPCIKEQNEINKKVSKLQQDTGVRIIAITPEKKSKIPRIKEIARKYDWKHEIYVDYSKRLRYKLLGDWYGVPQTFVFDGNFKILHHGMGYNRNSIAKIEKLLYQMTKEAFGG